MENRFLLTPFFLDQPLPGLDLPAKPGWQINHPSLPDGTKQFRMSEIHRSIAAFAAETVSRGHRAVSIAGDCCTAIGVLAGLQRIRVHPTLIWFDAHGDFNTWETTPGGFLGGMPLAMIVGRGEQTMPNALGLKPFPEERVYLTDARDLDPKEKVTLENSGIVHLKKVKDLLDAPLPEGPLYVHFDTDIVDPGDAPAMNYPAPGGPSVAELQGAFRSLARTGRIAAVSLSSWNPMLDGAERSRKVCMTLLDDLLDQ